MFEIFGTPTASVFGMMKSSSVSSVTDAANIALMPWTNPGFFVDRIFYRCSNKIMKYIQAIVY